MILNFFIFVYFISGALLFLLGLLIFREQPRQRINRVTAAMLFFAAVGPIFAAFGLVLESSPGAETGLHLLGRIFLIWEFFFPQLVVFSLLFPKEHKILQTHPRWPLLLYLPQIVHFFLVLFFSSADQIRNLFVPENFLTGFGPLLEPVRFFLKIVLSSAGLVFEYHEAYFALINLIYVVTAIINMHLSYAQLESIRLQKQVRLIVWGIRVSTGLYAIAFLLPKFLFLQVSTWQAYALTSFGLLLGACAITWAIVRYHFLDVEFIIRRGFIFSATSGALVGLYLLLYGEIKMVASGALGQGSKFVEALFFLFAIIAFQPLLNFFETLVDRIFYRHASDYRKTLQELSQEVLTILDPVRLREKIVNALSESLLVEAVYLLLPGQSGQLETLIPERPGERAIFSKNSDLVRILMQEKQAIYRSDIYPQLQKEPERQNLRRMRAEIILPLLHRGELLGILILGKKIMHTTFSYEEMSMLSLLADQLAISLENVQLYQDKLEKQRIEEELLVARGIQRALLPQDWPGGPNFELCALNIPSKEIGGDYYDFVRIANNRLGIAIGDVSGKGIPGAILMSNLQAAFRAYALRYPSPRMVVSQLNDHLAYTTAPEKYVTFFYGVLEYEKRRFTFTNAGHNYPLLCREGRISPMEEGDLIIGVRPGQAYHQRTLKLRAGDLILFYTDGVTEAFDENERFFGEERLTHLLKQNYHAPIKTLQESIYQQVCHFSNGSVLQDDLTIVILRVK